MLTFFRRYQRFFFLFTSVVVIASFSFFGTSGGMDRGDKRKKEVLCKDISGALLTKERVDKMTDLLSSSHWDLADEKVSSPNWLNDGVLEKDFLLSPLGGLLAEKIAPEMGQELRECQRRARAFRAYAHPFVSSLHTEALWGQFVPESVRLASEVLKAEDFLGTFHALSRFHLAQRSFPSFFLRRVFLYQEAQMGGETDPSLPYADLSLLGLHSLQDAVGPTYVRAVVQFVLNASAYAKTQGIKVSSEEVREDLLQNVIAAAQKVTRDFDATRVYSAFIQQVKRQGLDEPECLSLWKDVMLFRKLFTASVFKALPENWGALVSEAKQRARIEVFSLPSYLRPKDFTSLLKIQTYFDAVCSSKVYRGPFTLPSSYKSVDEVEKVSSDLVARDYVLAWTHVDLHQASASLGLKEMWTWQTSDEGWTLLQEKFPYLLGKKSATQEERFLLLESLDTTQRERIDQVSKETILLTRGVNSLFEGKEPTQTSCAITKKGRGLPFEGLVKPEVLVSLLEKEQTDSLACYTEDKQHYYAIKIVERASEKRVLKLEEALQGDTLLSLLDKRLEGVYPEVRKKAPKVYKSKDGGWEPLSRVREKVGLSLYPDLLRAIRDEYTTLLGKEVTQEDKESPLFYAHHWVLGVLKHCQEEALLDVLVKEEKTVGREEKPFFEKRELFSLEEGAISPVLFSLGRGCFFRMMNRFEVDKLSKEEEENLLFPFAKEAKERLFLEILKEIETKKAMSL